MKQKELAKEAEPGEEPVPKVQKVEEKAEAIEAVTEIRNEYYEKILSVSDDGAARAELGTAASSRVVDLKSVYKASLASFLESGGGKESEMIEGNEVKDGVEDEECEETEDPNVYSSSYLAMVEKEKALSDASDDSEDEEDDYKNEEVYFKL